MDRTNQTGTSYESHLFPLPGASTDVQFSLQSSKSGQPDRTYEHILSAPVHYEPRYEYPLVIWLHSPGRDEHEILSAVPRLSMRNYVAVAPRAVKYRCRNGSISGSVSGRCSRIAPMYDWPTDGPLVEEAEERIFRAIDRARSECSVSSKRIFLVGLGSGGTFALKTGTKYPEYFAGAVSMLGAFPKEERPLRCWRQTRSFPIFLAVGLYSRTFTPADAALQLRLFHTAGMSALIHQYETADQPTAQMYRDVNHWIMDRVTGGH